MSETRQDGGVTDLFDPFIRMVASPLTEQMLRRLDPRRAHSCVSVSTRE